MSQQKTVIAAGGVVIRDGKILLVRTTYGRNKGLWMIPGGLIEPGESIEAGAVREVLEESNVIAEINGIRAIRTGVRLFENEHQTNLYIAFNMTAKEGLETPDGKETSEAGFFTTSEIEMMNDIVGLSKSIILKSYVGEGLFERDIDFDVNHIYSSYHLYK